MKTQVRNSLLCGTLALSGLFAAVAPADAAVYRGRFDPDYGVPFSDMRWGGSLEVVVPDTCVPTSAGTISVLGCGGMQISQALVEVYNKNTSALVQTMDFGAAAGSGLNGLNWMLEFGGSQNLIGANSTAFPAIKGTAAETKRDSTGADAWFSLQFLGDYAQLYWFDEEPGNVTFLGFDTGIPDEVALSAGATVGPVTIGGICRSYGVNAVPNAVRPFVAPDYCGWSNPDEFQKGSFITFSRVPEPATLALVPAALAAMGLISLKNRRRRSPKL